MLVVLQVQSASSSTSLQVAKRLPFSNCCDVANYYLGFNGWCISIVNDQCDVGPSEVACSCAVVLAIKGISDWTLSGEAQVVTSVAGSTQSHDGAASKLHAIGLARKLAYQYSCEKAFSKLILVTLPNGKISVHKICDDE